MEMPPAPETDLLQLSVFQHEHGLTLFLTDGNSMQRMVTVGDASEAISDLLDHIPPRRLNLLLPEEADALPWESMGNDIQRLGDKFAISRQLVSGATPCSQVRATPPTPAHQVVAIWLGPEECRHQWQDQPQRPTPRITRRFVSQADWTPASQPTWVSTDAILVLPAGDEGLRALRAINGLERPGIRLLVLELASGTDALPWIRLADQCGLPLALRVAPLGSEEEKSWIDGLFTAIDAGCSVAEAVRRLRVTSSDPPSGEICYRAYGPAHAVLLQPPTAYFGADGHRQVTAASYDLVKSTALLQRVGSEVYSELIERYHAQCAAIVRLHGGKAGDPQGNDGVMCYFGFPIAQEDVADRAVRACLALQCAAGELGLQIRVGVATGWVAVKNGQPWGLSVHLAARLRDQAQPGQVLLAKATQKMLRGSFEIRCLRQKAWLKDINEPQDILLVEHEVSATGHDRRGRILPTPFVGRGEEFSALRRRWSRARQGHGEVVLVQGDAGIGKSRLLREFRRLLQREGQRVLCCYCRQESQGSPFAALIVCLRWLAGVALKDSVAAGLEKLVRQMPASLVSDNALARSLVAELVLPSSIADAKLLGMGSERIRRQTLEVLLEWFVASAAEQPLCLIVDDAHWIDPSTREFLDRLTEKTHALALMVVVAQRQDADSTWRPNVDPELLELRGLPMDSAWELVRHACGSTELPESAVRLVAARGDGVPLFLEESARVALDLGLGGDRLSAPLITQVPETLQDVLMTRLDRLGESKPVAQLAAVLGREFSQQLLVAVLDFMRPMLGLDDCLRHVDEIETSGLLLRVEQASGSHYRFKHALVCDTAYQSLWERDRRAIHAGVATILETRFPATVQQQPEILARHFSESGQWDRACRCWEAAARQAAARSAHAEALQHARAALAELSRLPSSRQRDEAELRLQVLMAARLIALAGYGAEAVEVAYLRASALSLALSDGRSRDKIDLGLEAYYFMRADFERARALAQRIMQGVTASTGAGRHLQAHWAIANIEFHEGRLDLALDLMDECLALYQGESRPAGLVQDPAVMCLCYSAWGWCARGDEGEALQRVARLLALATTLDHRFSLAEAHGFAASVMLFCGRYQEALHHAEQAVLICEEDGYAVWLAHALVMKGRVQAQLGEVVPGLALMRRGYDLWVSSGAVVTRPFYLAMQAEVLLQARHWADAADVLNQAVAISERTGEHYHRAELLRLLGVCTLADCGAAQAQAEALFRAAIACADSQGRHGFAVRAALDLARLLTDQGRHQDAGAELQRTLTAHPSEWVSQDRHAAEAWLARSAIRG